MNIRALRHRAGRRLRWLFSRWSVADMLNRSDRACWCDLVEWALHDRENHRDYCDKGECYRRLRDSLSGGERCRQRSTETDICYCGKFAHGRRSTPADFGEVDHAPEA